MERCTYSLDQGSLSANSLELQARGLGHFAIIFGGMGTASWHITIQDDGGKQILDQNLTGNLKGKASARVNLPGPPTIYTVTLQRN